MNMRAILLMAATVAPLSAQEPPPVAPAEPTVAAPSPADQRAAKLGALALLPKDAADFVVLADVGGNVARLAGGCCPCDASSGGVPAELLAIDNIALANTAASAPSLAAAAQFASSMCGAGMAAGTVDGWIEVASGAALEALRQVGDPRACEEKLIADVKAFIPSVKVAPQYAVVTCKPGGENVLEKMFNQAVQRLADEAGKHENSLEKVEGNGFTGVKLDFAKALEEENDVTPALREALAGRAVYVLLRLQGNALIGVICENPEEISLASTPADSMLATDAVAEADPVLAKDLLGLLRVSPELQALGNAPSSSAAVRAFASVISSVFNQLAEKDAAHQAAYAKAAAGVNALAAQYAAFMPASSQPATLQLWCDKGLHAVFSCDALGSSYKPAPLKHAAMADAPDTFVYAESTPCSWGATQLPSFEVVLTSLLDVAQGVAETLDASGREESLSYCKGIAQFLPELCAFSSAAGTVGSGLDGSWTVVMDSSQGHMPAVFGGGAEATVSFPRLSVAAGVSDRSKLGDGWNAFVKAAGQVIGKLGGDPASVGMLPIVPANVGAATTYKVALPFFTPDFVPSLAVSDDTLAIGTSDRLNAQLATAASGTTPFAGTLCSIRFAPLAKCLGSLADAMAPETPPAAEPDPRAVAEAVLREQDGDDDGDDFDAVAPEPPMKASAEELRTLANDVAELSKTVEGVSCTCTIENGKFVIKADVKLK